MSAPGKVIASHGRRVLLETADGARVPCGVLGRDLQVLCGDEVAWRPDVDVGRGIVVERLPRRSALERTNAQGATEAIVANLTQLVVVLAHEPEPDFFMVDRFLAAAELAGIRAAIVRNKIDAVGRGEAGSGAEMRAGGGLEATIDAELAYYQALDYDVVACSSVDGAGLAELEDQLAGEVSVLAGQSGVGKSSLANRLVPGLRAATDELTAATAEGRHVTSVSTLHHLPQGGDLIDSPGVRDFAPAVERIANAALAFREIAAAAAGCRFADCRHLREPDCAVQAAVADNTISARRYESFKRLSRLREQLAPAPGRRRRK